MASLVGSAANTCGSTTSRSPSATLPMGISDGDIAYALININTTLVLTVPSGWELVDGPITNTNIIRSWLLKRTCVAADSGTAFPGTNCLSSAARWTIGLGVITDTDGVDQIIASQDTSLDTTLTIPAYTPDSDDCYVFHLVGYQRPAGEPHGYTPVGDWAERHDLGTTFGSGANQSILVEDDTLVGQGGVQQPSQNGTFAGTTRVNQWLIVFAPLSSSIVETAGDAPATLAVTDATTTQRTTVDSLPVTVTASSDVLTERTTADPSPVGIAASSDSLTERVTIDSIPASIGASSESLTERVTEAQTALRITASGEGEPSTTTAGAAPIELLALGSTETVRTSVGAAGGSLAATGATSTERETTSATPSELETAGITSTERTTTGGAPAGVGVTAASGSERVTGSFTPLILDAGAVHAALVIVRRGTVTLLATPIPRAVASPTMPARVAVQPEASARAAISAQAMARILVDTQAAAVAEIASTGVPVATIEPESLATVRIE